MTDKRGEFYAAGRDDCLQIVLVTVGDRQLAEDLVAEAFTRVWASWRAVRQHPAPKAWVVRTALNLSVSWWRTGGGKSPLATATQPRRQAIAAAPAVSCWPRYAG